LNFFWGYVQSKEIAFKKTGTDGDFFPGSEDMD